MNRKLTFCTALTASALLAASVQAGMPPTAAATDAGTRTPPQQTLFGSAEQHSQLMESARAAAPDLARSLALGAQERLVAKDVVVDPDGTRHLRFDRTYAGLPFIGGDLIVHQNARGTVTSVTRASAAKPALPTLSPSVPADAAARTALTRARTLVGAAERSAPGGSEPLKAVRATGVPQRVVWAVTGTPRLAWDTPVHGVQLDGTPSELHVLTDASTGSVLEQTESVETVADDKGVHVGTVDLQTTKQGTGFELKDPTRGNGYTVDLKNGEAGDGTPFTNGTDTWGDGTPANKQSAAVDAQFGTAATWDFYKDAFKRSGIFNDGKGAYNRVHYGKAFVNAFWDDSCRCMTYGDGAGDTHPLTALDVAGHEMTHGVTSATANLAYTGESGGLNEATSDIFGTAVEWHANLPADVPDYLIGEQIDIKGDGTPLRYMDKPSKDGQSADYWSADVGNKDVHYSSGVANHFYYLLSEGSGAKKINGVSYDSPTQDGSKVTGIGHEKAEAIWYKALTAYFTSTTNYAAARTATLKAAADLYGDGSTEHKAVAAAWTAVNVK